MLYGSDRGGIRRAWVDAWSKTGAGQPLEPLERVLAEVVADHPEYHAVLESPDALTREFPPEAGSSNPFLHMGLHVAVREQLVTDRPRGILDHYSRLLSRFANRHRIEHALMECLAETLWDAQRAGATPNEARYLARVKRIAEQ